MLVSPALEFWTTNAEVFEALKIQSGRVEDVREANTAEVFGLPEI